VRVRTVADVEQATEVLMLGQARAWIDEAGGQLPPGNGTQADLWGPMMDPDAGEGVADGAAPVGADTKVSPFTQATVRACNARMHAPAPARLQPHTVGVAGASLHLGVCGSRHVPAR
jgi:hypothetical protein